MTTNKPEIAVHRYKERPDDLRSAWLYTRRAGHVPLGHHEEALIRLSDYEALQAAHEEELFQVRQDRDAHFGELMRALEQVDALQAECEELKRALSESRANDQQAMAYLNEVRAIVGGDDLPDMVRRCEKLRKDAERYRWWRNVAGSVLYGDEVIDLMGDPDAMDRTIDAAMQGDKP